MATTITIERVCPACNGTGKDWGRALCHCCYGDHKVTETITVENTGDETDVPGDGLTARIAQVCADALRGGDGQ